MTERWKRGWEHSETRGMGRVEWKNKGSESGGDELLMLNLHSLQTELGAGQLSLHFFVYTYMSVEPLWY